MSSQPLTRSFPMGKLLIFTAATAVVVVLVAFLALPALQASAVAAGFGLFASNVLVLAFLGMHVVTIVAHGAQPSKANKKLAFFLAGAKSIALFGVLFLLISVFELPGLYIFVGSLIALITLTGWLCLAYLKHLSATAICQDQPQQNDQP